MAQIIHKNGSKVFFFCRPVMQGNVRTYPDAWLLRGWGGVPARAINQPTFLKICMQVRPVWTKKKQLIFDPLKLFLYRFSDILTYFQTVLLYGPPSLTSLWKAKLRALFFHFRKTTSKRALGKNVFFAIFLKSGRTEIFFFSVKKK